MNVLVLSHLYPNNINSTYGIFVHEQVRALKKAGVNIKVISPTPWAPFPLNILKNKWKKYSYISKKDFIDGIEIFHPRKVTFPNEILFHKSGKLYYKAIKNIVKKIYRSFKFDLIHSHVALPDGYGGILLSEDYEIPLVTTIHGKDFQQTIYKNKRSRRAVIKVLEESDKIITVSDKLRKIGEKLIDQSNQFKTIENGFSKDKVFKGETHLKSKYNNEDLIILAVGNLKKTKGFDLLISSAEKILNKYDNIQFIFIGEGNEENYLKNMCKRKGIKNKIEFKGRLKHEKVMEYMSICDIFALPSWSEAFGVVYIEAMSHGKPVIACKGEGISGIIKNDFNGLLVKKKSVNSLTKALNYLINNEKERLKIGNKAKKTVSEYTWDYNAERNIKVYKKLLK